MIPKFRALNIKTGFWFDEQELVFCDGKWFQDWRSFEDDFPLDMQDCVVMESTGLKDKSAKYEINNKDILLVDTFPESSFKAKVVYESGSFGIVALKGDIVDYFPKHWNDTFMPLAELYWIFDCEDGVLDCVEILGNEFENPELLEEQ